MNLDTYIRLLILKISHIDDEIQTEMLRFIFDTFIVVQDKLLMIDNGQINKLGSRKVFETMLKMKLKIKFPSVPLVVYIKRKDPDSPPKAVMGIKISEIYDTIVSVNHFDMMRYESDPFADTQKVYPNRDTRVVTVVGNKINMKELGISQISTNDKKEILLDYKAHFKQFDELLKLIVDMRFAKDRKASFVHLRVKSNWGKSFLSGMLKNLQIGFEIDYHNLMNTGASSISPIQVRNSFVLILDEFNNFSQEMKKLSHEFTFAPKFGQSETIELYLKILMSAEKSPSFTGGVDNQIINRVMVFEMDDKDTVELTSRPIYKKHGNAKYMEVLEHYAHSVISKRIDTYLAQDKLESHRIADIAVQKTLKKYKMKAENLNDNTKFIINSAIYDILQTADGDYSLNPRLRELKTNIIEIKNGEHHGKVFVKSPQKVIETILKVETSEAEFKKMKYKLSNIDDVVNLVSDHRARATRINGRPKTEKGIIIDIEEARNAKEILEELKENGKLIIEKEEPTTLNKNNVLVDSEGNELF